MKCQYETTCGKSKFPQEEAQEATILVIAGPRKVQTPACEECARWWVNFLQIDIWLAPLESYVDHYAQARAAMKAEQNRARNDHITAETLTAAFQRCPEEVLRRIAEGDPEPADWHDLDILMGLSEHEADRRLADGTYHRITADVHGSAIARTPRPVQNMARNMLSARRPTVITVAPQQVLGAPAAGQGRHRQPDTDKAHDRRQLLIWGSVVAAIFGLVMFVGGLPSGTESGNYPDLAELLPGLGLVLASITCWIVMFLRAYLHWRRSLTPGQRKAVDYAVGVGALAAADIGLRAYNKRSAEHTARMRETVKNRVREMNLQAQALQAQTEASWSAGADDATRALLARSEQSPASQRRRRELGW